MIYYRKLTLTPELLIIIKKISRMCNPSTCLVPVFSCRDVHIKIVSLNNFLNNFPKTS